MDGREWREGGQEEEEAMGSQKWQYALILYYQILSRSDGELCTVLVLADFKGCEQRSTPKTWPLEAHREADSCNFRHLLYVDLLDLLVLQRRLTIALSVLGCSLTRNMTCQFPAATPPFQARTRLASAVGNATTPDRSSFCFQVLLLISSQEFID